VTDDKKTDRSLIAEHLTVAHIQKAMNRPDETHGKKSLTTEPLRQALNQSNPAPQQPSPQSEGEGKGGTEKK